MAIHSTPVRNPRRTLLLMIFCMMCVSVIIVSFVIHGPPSAITEQAHIPKRFTSPTIIRELQKLDPVTRSCQPVNRLIFIKTHKTGSTTTASIFERYGYLRNLSFAVGRSNHILSNSKLFTKSMVYKIPNRSRSDFDMMVNHARYNRKEMDATVCNSRYVSIIRDPVAQLESAFGYFEMARLLKIKTANPFLTFLSNHKLYDKSKSIIWNQGRNGQLFDLGFDHKYDNNMTKVNDWISNLTKEIDLMMINEYYDESLILLKKLMCWDYDDILYISNGIRSKSHRFPLTADAITRIKKWSSADVMLYEQFNKTFWEKVAAYGPNFDRDLDHFRELERNVTAQCVEQAKKNTKDKREDKAILKKNSTKFCQDLLRDDVEYTKRIRKGMVQRAALKAAEKQNMTILKARKKSEAMY